MAGSGQQLTVVGHLLRRVLFCVTAERCKMQPGFSRYSVLIYKLIQLLI